MGQSCSQVDEVPWCGVNGDGRGTVSSKACKATVVVETEEPPPSLPSIQARDLNRKTKEAWLRWHTEVLLTWKQQYGERFKPIFEYRTRYVGTMTWVQEYDQWWSQEYATWWKNDLERLHTRLQQSEQADKTKITVEP